MRKLSIFIVCFFCAFAAEAQFDAQFSQYWDVENYYNPAKAGTERNKLNLTALHRMQWLGMPGAPKTTFITGDAGIDYFGGSHGLGASFFNEKIGLFSASVISVQYAYKARISNGILSLGLEGGMFDLSFDGTKLHTPGEGEFKNDYHTPPTAEDIPQTEVKGSRFNVNFGVRYSTKHYYVGLSSTKLLEPVFDFNESGSTYIGRVYYLSAGGNIELSNPLYHFRPSFLVKTDLLTTKIDLTARILYNEMFWGGLTYRWKEDLIFSFGVFLKNIKVGYAYDYSLSNIMKVSSGCHEITATYTTDFNFQKDNRHRYKSIRVL